ncbi:MAG: putative lipid II flippase FtsW [Bifidobacteriaceae bacterium]|jgi:cell division protein FtsW|nr:putative lipid II flippase FtsW [Bifidobacteriaceae bacterium]
MPAGLALERPATARNLVTAYYMILVSTALLVIIGFVMVVSSTTVTKLTLDKSPYTQAVTQGVYIAVGLIVAFCASRFRFAWWKPVAWGAFILTLVLQAVTVLGAGISAGGNTNWLKVGGFSVQPSEFLKFALALWLGTVLANKKDRLDSWVELAVPALVGLVVAGGLVILGNDVGTASVIGLLALGTLWTAGVPWRKLAAITLVVVAVGAVAVLVSPSRLSRVKALLGGSAARDASRSTGWQTRQAAYALADGGLFGKGLGASHEKWSWLSQADSDFIFAIIGEELGLVGCLVVLVLFAVLIIGLLQVVRWHPDRFCQVTVGAIGCWIAVQAVINVGMVVQVLPVIGVPLPFVSSGGSALVASMAAIGCVLGLMRGDPAVGPVLKASPQIMRDAFGLVAAAPDAETHRRRKRRRRAARPAGTAAQGTPGRPVVASAVSDADGPGRAGRSGREAAGSDGGALVGARSGRGARRGRGELFDVKEFDEVELQPHFWSQK